MKRTLKRELKVLEIVKREPIGPSNCQLLDQAYWRRWFVRSRLILCGWLCVCSGLAFVRCTAAVGWSTSVRRSGRMVAGRWLDWQQSSVIACGRCHCVDWGVPSTATSGRKVSAPCRPGWCVTMQTACCVCWLHIATGDVSRCLVRRCWRNGFYRPVLKHGPRSLACMRVFGWKTLGAKWKWRIAYAVWGAKLRGSPFSCSIALRRNRVSWEDEHTCWDPKDSELCLHRVKPEEILVEARSDTDVQIVRQMWV